MCVGCAGAQPTLLFGCVGWRRLEITICTMLSKSLETPALFHARSLQREIKIAARIRLRSISSTELSRFFFSASSSVLRLQCHTVDTAHRLADQPQKGSPPACRIIPKQVIAVRVTNHHRTRAASDEETVRVASTLLMDV